MFQKDMRPQFDGPALGVLGNRQVGRRSLNTFIIAVDLLPRLLERIHRGRKCRLKRGMPVEQRRMQTLDCTPGMNNCTTDRIWGS